MAMAISALAERNPNALRVSSRVLVSVALAIGVRTTHGEHVVL
jgi:hypothetical protein